MPPADHALLTILCHSGHLRTASADEHAYRHEQRGALRLLARPRRTFLQNYDLLFRYLSLWLLAHNYELTGHQPHRVLARVATLLAPSDLVEEVVRNRHALKYSGQLPTPAAEAGMEQLLIQLAPPDLLR